MNVKRFEASSIAEALSKVKEDLGSDAVILHTRSYRRGGVMGFMAKNVVEITASADVNIHERRRKAAAAVAKRSDDSGEYAAQGAPAGAAMDDSKREAAAKFESRHVLRNAYGKGTAVRPGPQRSAVREKAAEAGGREAGSFGSTREMAVAVMKEPAFEIRNEISALRTMVESLLQRSARVGEQPADLPEQLAKAYACLIQQQVADELALRIIEDVKAEMTPGQLGNSAAVRERLVVEIAKLIPANAVHAVARPMSGGQMGADGRMSPRSICLIGPTGVGKTTTIAKLAAAFKLRQRQKVGLITIDTYRIAAVDQLRTYANIIGVPLKVVLTPGELVAAMKDMSDCDTILIDTAGRSPSDDLKLNELAGFIQAANPTEVHLVLASTTTQGAMEAALRSFSKVRVDQMIFTKLDEAVSFGVLLNVARKASKALSYITTGQDVPDHVEVGQPRRLAKLILGEKL